MSRRNYIRLPSHLPSNQYVFNIHSLTIFPWNPMAEFEFRIKG